jgi:hypothetical protein
MCTIGEWIKITAVRRIKNLAKTIRTGRNIRQDEGSFYTGRIAFADFKAAQADWRHPSRFQALDKAVRRFLGIKLKDKPLNLKSPAFNLKLHTTRKIGNPAGQTEFRGLMKYKRPESNALDGAKEGQSGPGEFATHENIIHSAPEMREQNCATLYPHFKNN